MIEDTSLRDIDLPKWPAMIVRGVPVTVEQAREIIRRTDTAFQIGISGNDRAFNQRVAEIMDLPRGSVWCSDENLTHEDYAALDAWRERWGVVYSEYITNRWIASTYVGGPHGWCHPDGTLRFDTNVGKWPSVEALLDEWTRVAEAFPFLDLTATLMSGEYCDDNIVPLVTIRVREGRATLEGPQPVTERATDLPEGALETLFLDQPGRECGVPLEWFDHWRDINISLRTKE